MAYGFRCAHCGWQETPHEIGNEIWSDGEQESGKHRKGYRHTLDSCPGFCYKRDDCASAAGEMVHRSPHLLVEEGPSQLREFLKKARLRYWKERGCPHGNPSGQPVNHSVFMILPSGHIVDIGL